MCFLLHLILVVILQGCLVSGSDFFESLNARLICYKDVQEGCNQDIPDAYPEYGWSHLNLTKATTHLYLFTKKNKDKPELLHKCAGDVPPNTNFNPKCRTEIFLPGFVSGICNFAIYRELKDERLKCGCYNVILVDWMWGNIFDLKEAKINMRIVAKHIVIMIRKLKARYGLSEDDFILTGHSYGAHMAAYVGQEEKVGIINGLDPSGVLFSETTPLDDRLDPSDAKCVHIMHCNAGQCLPGYFGVNFTCGHVDFWFNGGLFQPSCYPQTLYSFLKGDYIFGLFSLYPAACQHFQCLQYYKASMCPPKNKCQFLGINCESDKSFQTGKCRDCGINGEKCLVSGAYTCDCLTENRTGKNYYLNTDLFCPYCDNSKLKINGYSCPAGRFTNAKV